MLPLKLSNEQPKIFDETSEAGMGVHFARVEDELGLFVSDRIV